MPQKPLEEIIVDVKATDVKEVPEDKHYKSSLGDKVVDIVGSILSVALIGGGVVYTAMSIPYGPYDTGKVIYAELSGNKSLKHRHIEEAKWYYAKRIQKQELNNQDVLNLYRELRIVPTQGQQPSEDDVSWYRLLDWIEDNNGWWFFN